MKRIFLFIAALIALFSACKKDGELVLVYRNPSPQTIVSKKGVYFYLKADKDTATTVTQYTAEVKGRFQRLKNEFADSVIIEYGHCYSIDTLPTVTPLSSELDHLRGTYRCKEPFEELTDTFTSYFNNLKIATTYYVRSYVITPTDTGYNPVAVKFRTTYKPDQWRVRGTVFQQGREGCIGFSIGSYGYIAMGNDGMNYHKDLWRYDPNTNYWTEMERYPGSSRINPVVFILNGFAYVGLGQGQRVSGGVNETLGLQDFYKYNPNENWWYAVDPFAGGQIKNAVAFTLGDKAYVGLGEFGSTPRDRFFVYNLDYETTQQTPWYEIDEFPGGARINAVAYTIAGYGYVGTGSNHDTTVFYNDMYRLNPNVGEDGSWTRIEDFQGVERSNAIVFTIGDNAYLGLGESPDSLLSDLWKYDPYKIQSKWTKMGAVFRGGRRTDAAAFSIVDSVIYRGYVATGVDPEGNRLGDFYDYLSSEDLQTNDDGKK